MALENPSEEKAYAAWLEGINAEAEERGLSRKNWPKTREQFRDAPIYYRFFQAGCTPAETFEQIAAWAAHTFDPKGAENTPPRPTPPPQARPKPYLN